MTDDIREKAIEAAASAYNFELPVREFCSQRAIRAAIEAYEKALWRPIKSCEEATTSPMLVYQEGCDPEIMHWDNSSRSFTLGIWVGDQTGNPITRPAVGRPLPAPPEVG